jgi:hypothetical protein
MPIDRNARIRPAAVRHIKFGPGGAWENASLDSGRIDWGNAIDLHELALTDDWEGARRHYLAAGIMPSTATGHVRELKDFYTLGSDCLWITFARGHLWWCFAEPDVVFIGGDGEREGSRYRRAVGGWQNTDVSGRPLTIDSLSTRLTQLAATGAPSAMSRRTNICSGASTLRKSQRSLRRAWRETGLSAQRPT